MVAELLGAIPLLSWTAPRTRATARLCRLHQIVGFVILSWRLAATPQGTNRVRPWLYHFLMVPTIVGVLVVFGVAVAYRLDGLCSISDCVDRVPHWRALIVLAFLAFLVKWLERLWHKLRPWLHRRRPM